MTDLMAGEIIAIIMLGLAITYLISRLVRETPDIVDCGMVADVPTEPCPGPLVWFDVDSDPRGAIVECNACGYVLTTGNFHDQAHQETPLLRGAA